MEDCPSRTGQDTRVILYRTCDFHMTSRYGKIRSHWRSEMKILHVRDSLGLNNKASESIT